MIPSAAAIYQEAARNASRPDPNLKVSEWADEYRMLTDRSSPEPGPWRTSRVPYLKDIMDDLSPASPVERVVLMKGAQLGGPLALDTPVRTTEGWTAMGAITAGQRVFDENGQPCWVIGVSPIFLDHPCYRVRFSDGSELIADGSHRWRVWRKLGPLREELVTCTTEEMLPDYIYQQGNGNEHRYSLDLAGPLTFPACPLPLDPYVLGYWLGNGAAKANTASTHIEDSAEIADYLRQSGFSVDVQLPSRVAQGKAAILLIDGGRELKHGAGGRLTVSAAPRSRIAPFVSPLVEGCIVFSGDAKISDLKPAYVKSHHIEDMVMTTNMWKVADAGEAYFKGALQALGLINNKHIPACYQNAAISDRLALLQGLMDSDGTININGQASISTSYPLLRDGLYELISGLGIKATLKQRPAKVQSTLLRGHVVRSKVSFRFRFTAYSDIPVFRLRRKLDRQHPPSSGHPTETGRRRIVAIESVPSVPVRCIAVDSPNHLFCAGYSQIVSHNTEIGNNWMGFVIHLAPGPMMAVQPTTDMAKRNSKQRIGPLIQDCPILKQLVREPRERGTSGNTVLGKEFPGGLLVMVGANSGAGLRSMSARYLFLDEVDGYPGDVDHEGDPCGLAMVRTANFARSKTYIVSTPVTSGRSNIEKFYEESDQRQFWLPCPHCAEMQVLDFAQMRWPKGEPRKVQYFCIGCSKPIENHHKNWMLPRGEWRPRATNDRVHGYHISSLYSPVGWLEWGKIAVQKEAAGKDQQKLQIFWNTVLGLPFAESGEVPDYERLYERCEPYRIGRVPAGALILTAGVDVQMNRIECEIVGWGRDKQSWSIDYRVYEGPTTQPEVWNKLAPLIDEDFPSESGVPMRIRRMAVDSGFNTMTVYDFIRRMKSPRVIAVKGERHVAGLLGPSSPVEVGPQGRKVAYGIRLWPVNSDIAKEELYRWLRSPAPDLAAGEAWPVGYCHFPIGYSKEYFEQLCSEALITRMVSGRPVTRWEKLRERNDALDCRVYARAAAVSMRVDNWSKAKWDDLEDMLGHPGEGSPAASERSAGVMPASRTPVPEFKPIRSENEWLE